MIEQFGKAFVDELGGGPVVPADASPLSNVEPLDDTDTIRVLDVLVGDQPVTFSEEALDAARKDEI